MAQPLISYIIPAKNAGATIERAIRSITDYANNRAYEIIVAENDSTDNTCSVVKGLMAANDKIHLISCASGVSAARNAGLDNAKGEWVFFIDADDYFIEDSMTLAEKCAVNEDASVYFFAHEAGDRKVSKVSRESRKKNRTWELLEGDEFRRGLLRFLENPTVYLSVWAKLFRRSIIEANHIRFDESLRLAEDSLFVLTYLQHCESVYISDDFVYHYSIDVPSAMRTYDGKKWRDYVQSMKATEKLYERCGYEIKHSFGIYVLMHLNIIMVREIFVPENKRSFYRKRKIAKHMCEIDIFAHALKGINRHDISGLRMLPVYLMKKKMYLPASLIYVVRSRSNKRREKKAAAGRENS